MANYTLCSLCGMVLLLATTPAYSHHQLGLPHYQYSENYPQIPTMVIDADAEGYQVTFSIFPGNPRPGEIVRLKVYIKHQSTGEAYTKPVTLSVSSESFLRGRQEIMEPVRVQSEFNEYKLSYEFPNAEQYFINVTFEPRQDFLEKIPFPIVIGETNFSLIPIGAGIIFAITFLLVGFTNKRKHSQQSENVVADHA
jgi:hypothetical protein